MLGVDTARPHADEYILTPSVADPVGSMLRTVPVPSIADPASKNDLDHIVSTCAHPGIQIVRFPNGEASHHCTVCAKTWGSLEEAVDDAEQTQPISTTEMGEGGIPAAVEQMASEMSFRLGETMSQLVAATNPGTAVAIGQYEDFASMTDLASDVFPTYYDRQHRDSLRANTPFVRSPLQVREGGQTQNINMPEQDPGLAGVRARIEARVARIEARVAQREAKDATARRNKAMEDAAKAAAAAFDAGIEAERNPVKLDGDRKLKAI
jgi:hypothetical protein